MADYRRMLPSAHLEHLERSRKEILTEIGEHPDLVFIRGAGNRGDELISAGVRRLLAGLVFREIGIEELSGATGHTALICGGGAFCHSFHDLMPHVLAVAELRFERVILLPSTFDTSVDVVRAALRRSRAVIFAREQESYRRIRPLCDARIAHDCAFFFDFEPYRAKGSGRGILNAFRTDSETAGRYPTPPDSDDISITAGSMDAWLRQIAAHELVRTDRAHVMIAAAMLGKTVEYAPGSYFKVPAIADYSLAEFSVRRLATPADPGDRAMEVAARRHHAPEAEATRELLSARAQAIPAPVLPASTAGVHGDPRVTAVILTHERPELALAAVDSVIEASESAGIPVHVLVVDHNPSDRTRAALSAACEARPAIELHVSDRNLGRAGGRALALEWVSSELVLFLEDDAELMPAALAHLLSELDRHPEALGVSATVVLADGRVSHSGGWYRESSEIVSFTFAHAGLPLESSGLSPSGVCDWVPGTAALVRRGIFEQFPLDPGMAAYCEDAEWGLRVTRALPGCFRRSREALILHHAQPQAWGNGDSGFYARARVVEMLETAAHFHRRHRRLLRVPGMDVFALVPGLVHGDGTLELVGARILMELGSAHSSDWLLMQWMNGGLDPLLRGKGEAEHAEREAANAELHALGAQLESVRGELESAARQLEHAGGRIEAAQRERDEAWGRLRRIYGSRLWRLGASYDRARRGVRAIRSLGGSQ
jgi:GT2 family glycosyltransferase